MAALNAVGNARHLGLRERGAQEIELAGAGVTVAQRNTEHRAVVLRDDERAIVAAREIGQIAVFIQDVGDGLDPLGKAETNRTLPGALQAAFGATSENALQEHRVFVFDILQEFVGQFHVGSRKERIACGGQGVNMPGPAGATAFRGVRQQTLAFERGQGLAGAAQSHTQFRGDGIRRRVAAALDLLQDAAACFGQAVQGIGHAVRTIGYGCCGKGRYEV